MRAALFLLIFGTLAPAGAAAASLVPPIPPPPLSRWREVGAFLRNCWAPPPEPVNQQDSPREVTLRLGFSRAGRILGTPRVTHSQPPPNTGTQQAFTAAARAALARCSPLPF